MTKDEADKVITSFSPLASYVKWRKLSESDTGMNYLKSALLIFVDQGMREIYSDSVLIAGAGAISYLTLAELPKTPEEQKGGKTRNKAILDSAQWLVSEKECSLDEAKDILMQLLQEFKITSAF